MEASSLSPLGLTHILYDSRSQKAEIAALVTLSPILLMPVYAGIIVKSRELTVINMMLGQLLSDIFNHILKRAIKQDRPNVGMLGDGYGFPSSHSQYMGYFSTFLLLHLSFRHTFTVHEDGWKWLNHIQKIILYGAILLWTAGVCFSRYFLHYHTFAQVLSGYSIGVVFGAVYYFLTETRGPAGLVYHGETWPSIIRQKILDSRISQFWRIRDGWAVYSDGGHEDEWKIWRAKWDLQKQLAKKSS